MPNRKLIMVVKRELLFARDYFQGFRPPGAVDYESRIIEHCAYHARGQMEDDPSWKQPIGYALIVNPARKTVFAYRRSSRDSDYQEKRLQGKWSWGVGGHIEKIDLAAGNPIRSSMLREIGEEIGLSNAGEPVVLGYINDDSDAVGKVHFGILYAIPSEVAMVEPKSAELKEGSMRPMEELQGLITAPGVVVEEWSKIALPPLMKYLERM